MKKNILKTFIFACLIFSQIKSYAGLDNPKIVISGDQEMFDDLDTLIDVAIKKDVIKKDAKFEKNTSFQMAMIKVAKPFLRLYLFSVLKYRMIKDWVIRVFRRWFENDQKNVLEENSNNKQ